MSSSPRPKPTPRSPGTTASTRVRAHPLDLAGDYDAARGYYRLAARRTLSVPEQRYLESKAEKLTRASG